MGYSPQNVRRIGIGGARGQGVGRHICPQSARVAGLDRFNVSHEQADARVGGQARTQVTDAVRGCEPTTRSAPAARAARARKGLALRVRRAVRRRETAWGVGETVWCMERASAQKPSNRPLKLMLFRTVLCH